MRRTCAAAICALVLLVLAQAPATAASPESGKITSKKTKVQWSGGPFFVSRPAACLGPGDTTCDYFFLKVSLRDGARIEVRLTAPAPATGSAGPVSANNYDLYVWTHDNTLIAEGSSDAAGVETLTFTHRTRYSDYPYEVEVVPFLVEPDSTYKAKARALTKGR